MPVVRHHMSRELLTVAAQVSLRAAVQRMVERGVGATLVLEGERLAGILTERDVLRAFAADVDPDAVVGDWMTAGPETIAPDDSMQHAAVLMIHGGFRHLPVVAGDEVLGMLSIRDLMTVVLEDSAPRGV